MNEHAATEASGGEISTAGGKEPPVPRYACMAGESWSTLPTAFEIVIDGLRFESRRVMFSVAEVAVVLGVGEAEVGRMVAEDELRDVSSTGDVRLDPCEVVGLVEQRVSDGLLDKSVFVVLVAVVSGCLQVFSRRIYEV